MNRYFKPIIAGLTLETHNIRLQGTGQGSQNPIDCSSDSLTCGSFASDLGSLCTLNGGAEQGLTTFFLPDSNPSQTPSCTMTLNDIEASGPCQISAVDEGSCEAGAVWQITCDYPDGTCLFVFNGPSQNIFSISCAGLDTASCDTLTGT